MIKDYRILLVLTVVAVVLLGMSIEKIAGPEWAKTQKEYYQQLEAKDFTIEIKQTNVKTPGGLIIDRCQSCHIGAGNPDATGLAQPMTTHPAIVAGAGKDPHDFTKIGCVVCHDGNGHALEKHDAHGQFHGWPSPLLKGALAQANCNRCHAMQSGHLAGAEKYEKGRELFIQKTCWGCHTIAGISTASQAPELSNAGGKFHFEYLVESIEEPTANIATSKMPKFDWIDDKEKVEALAIYLKGQQKERLRSPESTPIGAKIDKVEPVKIDTASVEAGRAIFAGGQLNGKQTRGGCINCHSFKNHEGVLSGGSIGPELTYAYRARGKAYVRQHIANSRVHVADSIMPIFREFSDVELDSLVDYLATFDYTKQGKQTGAQLFNDYCVSCHGQKMDGNGRVARMLDPLPRSFTPHFVAAYQSRFKNSIREGVKGTAMPTWKNILTDDEIDLLIAYIKARSLKDSKPFERIGVHLPKPGDLERADYKGVGIKLVAGRPEKGAEAFQKYCTSCHGKLANGKGPNAYFLEHPLPRNLINAEFLHQPGVTDERLYQSILLGVAGTPMPTHDFLKDQTIIDIIAFLRGNTSEEKK